MAYHAEFIPAFAQNLQRMEQEGQLEKLFLVRGVVAAIRAVVRFGRPAAEAVYRQMVGGNAEIDPEDIFAQVDWQQPTQLAQQQQSTPASSMDTDRRPPSLRRHMGFEELALTPQQPPQQQQQQQPQQQQQQQPPQQQQQHTTHGQVAVQVQVQRLESGQQLVPVADENDHRKEQMVDVSGLTREEVDSINEQNLHTATRTSLGVGERPLPQFDPWGPNSSKDQNETILRTERAQSLQPENNTKDQNEMMLRSERARSLQLETELRRMQQIVQDMQHKLDLQLTPVRHVIATPTILAKDENVIDMNSVRKAKTDGNDKTIIAGVIIRPNRSPTIVSSSESGEQQCSPGGMYQLGNGDGGRDGGGDDGLDRDDSAIGTIGRNYNYNRKSDFIFVKSSNINIAKFNGANLNTYPYLPFYKSVRRLIYNQGEDGELLLDILTEVEQ